MIQFLPQIASLAQGAGSIMDLFGIGRPKTKVMPTQGERQATSLLMALNDPNNSLVEQESQINLQRGMNDLLTVLKQQQMMDARRMGRGLRGTFYSPERADEAISFLTSRAIPNLSYGATQQAKSDIRQRAQDFLGLGQQQGQRDTTNMLTNLYKYQRLQNAGGFGGGFGSGVRGLIEMLSPQDLPWQSGVRSGRLNANPVVGVF